MCATAFKTRFCGDKFRKIRLTNEKIAAVMAVEGAKTAMLTMGWVENEEFLVLPAGVRLSMKEVRDIEDAKIKLQLQKEPPGQSTVLSTSTPTELMCGADVVIHSLVRSPELNGVRGKIVEPQDPASRRWGVKIDSDGRVIALKPDNLSMTAPARSFTERQCDAVLLDDVAWRAKYGTEHAGDRKSVV